MQPGGLPSTKDDDAVLAETACQLLDRANVSEHQKMGLGPALQGSRGWQGLVVTG